MARNLFATDNEKSAAQESSMRRSPRNLFAQQEPVTQESFLDKLPRNIATGLANLGHSLINTPYDVSKIIERQGNDLGAAMQKAGIQSPQTNFNAADMVPHQKEMNFAQMLGQRGAPTFSDTAIQKGVQYAPEILLGANALRSAGILPHLTRRGASRSLREARELGKSRNIAPLNVNSDLIDDAAQFLPKTAPYRNAIENAHYGDYDQLFNLQSDLGKHSSDYARSFFSAAERAHGRAGHATRNRLLDEIHRGLEEQGHHDISELLRKGQNEYRRYMAFKPYRNALGLAAGAYMLPKNALIDLFKKLVNAKGN